MLMRAFSQIARSRSWSGQILTYEEELCFVIAASLGLKTPVLKPYNRFGLQVGIISLTHDFKSILESGVYK
jgi:hypothetical protein